MFPVHSIMQIVQHYMLTTLLVQYLPLSARIQLKILVLVVNSKLDVAPKYLRDHFRSPLSATSHRPLCSFDWQVLFVPRVRTNMAQSAPN